MQDAPTVAAQALRQEAIPFVPSGQHGQGFESSVPGIESAHGICSAVDATLPAVGPAAGANVDACAATST